MIETKLITMKRFLILAFIGFPYFIQAQSAKTFPILKGEYFGQKPPGLVPEVFAPDFISGKGRMHCLPTISPDHTEIYWQILPPQIMVMKQINGNWTKPEPAGFSNTRNNQAPFVSNDNTIYFSSSREKGQGSLDIWYITKENGEYGEPINIGLKINTDKSESQPTVSENRTIYYSGNVQGKLYNRGIYYSKFINGEYSAPVLLPEPINIMDTNVLDYTPFIAKDESYLLFCSNRQNPEKELCHIYISFKKNNGEWSEPVDLSLKMNFNSSSKFPYVSPDGKFLFFSSGENIYWIDSKILSL